MSLCSSISIDKYLGIKEAPEYSFGRSDKNDLSPQIMQKSMYGVGLESTVFWREEIMHLLDER